MPDKKMTKNMMQNNTAGKANSYLAALLLQKCPRCRQGRLFRDKNPYHLKHTLAMNEHCPVCGQKTEIETGFYVGTGYVSYALTVAFSVATFIAWWVLVGCWWVSP
jgi:hypothetical protein